MKDILLQQLSEHQQLTYESTCADTHELHAHMLCSHQTNPAEVKVDLHTAAGGNLTAISEPGDLWPGETVYPRCMDESSLTLGYSLRPFTLHKTTHI